MYVLEPLTTSSGCVNHPNELDQSHIKILSRIWHHSLATAEEIIQLRFKVRHLGRLYVSLELLYELH